MYDLASMEEAAARVHAVIPPTPQYAWPLLAEAAGCEVWLKHENHTPIGAFKVRGGINYVHNLKVREPGVTGLIAASTGNHGQSVAYAAKRAGLTATIVVPEGNNPEKNAAMRGFGAELIEHGRDFNVSLELAEDLAKERGLHTFPSYHADLVRGVGSYAMELFRDAPALDTVYVPIGMGSGCNGVVAARDALDINTKVVGVVAKKAPCYLHSFEQKTPVPTNTCDTFAEGLAVRIPNPEALEMILGGVERVVTVSEDEMAEAMRVIFSATHNVAEGAGASAFAGLMQEKDKMAGKRVGAIVSGGNIDRPRY
ncbi:MAG: threonine dehydratase, partial [Rhodospirillaceae bacterium]|nr:threonine dehydratase [Rhodospirillaceae bacterium]